MPPRLRLVSQPTLLDEIAAREAANRAIEQVDRAADPAWKKAAMRSVAELAALRPEFTTDDVWESLHRSGQEMPREPRALGAVMRTAAKMGFVEASDRYAQSARVACHRRPIRIWVSRICPR